MDSIDINQLKKLCAEIRQDVIKMIGLAGSGHPGGCLSCVELMVAAYYSQMDLHPDDMSNPEHDRFILSKGHCAPTLYSVLAHRGFFDSNELWSLRKLHSRLQGHPDSKKCPGVEVATGSLGQGISIAVGMALAAKYLNKHYRTYVLTGDGELQEGQVWEAMMSAAHYKLDNLTVMIDWNGLQIDGSNDEVMSLGDLNAKLKAFGFYVVELEDGNDIEAVIDALNMKTEVGKPKAILAHTVKGKGVSFMENKVPWHGQVPTCLEVETAIKELGV